MEHNNVKISSLQKVKDAKEIFKKFSGDKILDILVNKEKVNDVQCKLFIEGSGNTGEVVWAEVEKVESMPDGFSITAVLVNSPKVATNYKIGDTVQFHSKELINLLIGNDPYLPLDLTKEFKLYVKAVEFTINSMLELSKVESSYDFDSDLIYYYNTTIKEEGVLGYTQFVTLVDNIVMKNKSV